MVAKISIGSSLYGALSYNGMKMNRDEGRVLGANKIILPADGHIDIARMVENFNLFMPKTGRTKKPVLHISLNPHPDDKLTEQQYEILAREYLEKLGFGEQPYIIYKHMDIDRHHIHIVTVNVNEQGKRLNQAFLFRRSKAITNELEQKYNLHKAQREKVSPDTPIKKLDPSGDIKRQVQNTVKLVSMRYKFQTLGEYNAILSLYNIRCEPTDGRVNGREYHGLVYFAMNDNGDTVSTPFKASRLGKFASRAAVEGHFERSKESVEIRPTKRIVASVMAQSSGQDDFITRLKDNGIDLVLRYNEDGRIYGATFVDHNTHTVLNGSRLGKEFSANAFERWFNGDGEKPILSASVTPNTDTTQTAGDTSAPPQPNPSTGQSQANSHDYKNDYEQPTLPGLDLFQVGPGFNPEEEAFYRAMQRRKKRRRGPQL